MHFLLFFFLANDLLLAVYFIFILDYGNDFRQKANSSDFLIHVIKQQRQLMITTMCSVQELLTNVQYGGSSRSFVKETTA